MTDTQSTSNEPKQSSWIKKFFWIVAIVLTALGVDHYTFHYVSGGVDVDVTLTDSTVSTAVHVDTTITIAKTDIAKTDTAKVDTTKK